MWVRLLSFTCLLFTLMLLVCKAPSSSPGPENAFVALEFKSSSGTITKNTITDTIGNHSTICLIYNLTQYIDASTLKITKDPDFNKVYQVTSFKRLVDTIYYPITFSAPGSYTVNFSSSIEGQPTIISGIITIVDRPQIIQKPVLDSVPPVVTFLAPSKDTVLQENSIIIKAFCKDSSGIRSLTGTYNTTTFEMNRTNVANVWSGEIKRLVSGCTSVVKLVATDSSTSSNRDSASIKIKYDADTSKPVLTRVNPVTEIAGTNSSSYSILLTCSDSSGVMSVNATFGSQSFTGIRGAGNNWTIAVFGLVQGFPNEVVVTATDSSIRANKTLLNYAITFDPTMLDTIGPTITPVSGPTSGTNLKTPVVDIVVNVSDPSSVDSVYCMKNNVSKKMLTAVTGKTGQYALNDTLTEGKVDTLTLVAVDKSTRHNQTKLTVTLLYSKPKYSVSYNGNGNIDGSIPIDAKSYDTGATVTVTGNTGGLIKNGYTFDGWNTAADGNGTSFVAGTGTFVISSNVTLFAKWKIKTYKLSYNGNGNTGGTAPVDMTLDSNALATVAANTTLSKTGFDFNGWNTKADGNGTVLVAGTTLRIKSDATLYAQWTVKKYTLTISKPLNGTVNLSGTNSVDSGAVTTLIATPASGFKFKQWIVTSGVATIVNQTSPSTTVKLTQGTATIMAVFVCITFAKELSFSQYAQYSFVDGVQTEDGGYLIVGNVNNELLLVKLDTNGDTVWTKTTNYLYDPHSICKADNGFIISGYSSGVNNNSAQVMWCAQNGNNIGGWGLYDTLENSIGYKAMLTKDNNYIIAGQIGSGYFLTILDNNRTKLWFQSYDSIYSGSLYDCKPTRDGGYILVGGGSMGLSGIAIKANEKGEVVWRDNFKTSTLSNYSTHLFKSVDTTSSGNYVIVGAGNINGISKGFLLGISQSKDIQLFKEYSDATRFQSIKITKDGSFFIAGSTFTLGQGGVDIYIIKTNTNGTITNYVTYGTSADEDASSLQLTSDGGAIIVGNHWVIKTDENGKVNQ